MTEKCVQFVVCRTLPEMLRLSASAIDKLGTEFCLCDCRRCGQSLVIGIEEATSADTLELEIVCQTCATRFSGITSTAPKPN